MPVVRSAWTSDPDPDAAAQAIFAALDPQSLAGVILFCSSRYPVEPLAQAILQRCDGVTVIGCTSSGEITADGFVEGSIVAIGFPASDFSLCATRFDALDDLEASQAQAAVRSLVASAAEGSRQFGDDVHHAAIFLVDGLSHREEMLTVTLQDALGPIPLIGGSSGDGFAFRETFVLDSDGFHCDAALVAILSTRRRLHVFRSQPYLPGSIKMVITGADPVARIVHEINAEPAADEYARLAGVRRSDLGPQIFASRPPMVRAGGEHYVRSIQSANDDGSLTFYCAIDEGLVLTLGAATNIVGDMQALFTDLQHAVGGIDQILGFNCVLNQVEIEQQQLSRQVAQLMIVNRVVGFNSYGEQFHALHVNQTFSGLAIGQ
ncbi:FIST N-terminal domain-containing protein [Sphingomonas sp. 37zxx]|uniref:FIST N-terminal domain-containing protein n=1 Tax=Sphingomonas sp. 37zxx TaxID=1550073 RepID=UPI00068F7EA3|nr:FIST N-terminal domain-containing protein [Sphingomonas sp. 37zxx]